MSNHYRKMFIRHPSSTQMKDCMSKWSSRNLEKKKICHRSRVPLTVLFIKSLKKIFYIFLNTRSVCYISFECIKHASRHLKNLHLETPISNPYSFFLAPWKKKRCWKSFLSNWHLVTLYFLFLKNWLSLLIRCHFFPPNTQYH